MADSGPDPTTGAILQPIYQSTTFVQQAVGVHKGFTYSRAANPTVDALERALAALEGTPATVCFATGMAAITTLFLSLLKSGDHVVISEVVYGGTVRLCQQLLSGLGIEHTLVDASRAELVEQAITPRTKLIFIETPGNPTLKLCDIPRDCGRCSPARCASRGGQHLPDAGAATCVSTRRRHQRALHHQVHRGPQRDRRRFTGDAR